MAERTRRPEPWPRGVGRTVASFLAAAPLLAGCATVAGAGAAAAPVVVQRIAVPVHEPVWSHHADALLALVEGSSRIAKIDPAGPPGTSPAGRTTVSAPVDDVGENIEPSPTDDSVYLPQPRLGRVAVVSADDLRRVGTLEAGPAPSYVAIDSGSTMLLAMPPDGSTVTAVDLHDHTVLPPRPVRAGPEAEVDGGQRGRLVDYHVAGPEGVAAYKGAPLSVNKEGEAPISVQASAGDLVKPSRLYVAEAGSNRLIAVDTKRTLHGLHVVAQSSLDAPVRHLGADETRVYAATEHELVVLETNSFEGYPDGEFSVVDTIDYRSALPTEELRAAPLSGLAVGPDRVYLTFTGEPYLVSVAKPNL